MLNMPLRPYTPALLCGASIAGLLLTPQYAHAREVPKTVFSAAQKHYLIGPNRLLVSGYVYEASLSPDGKWVLALRGAITSDFPPSHPPVEVVAYEIATGRTRVLWRREQPHGEEGHEIHLSGWDATNKTAAVTVSHYLEGPHKKLDDEEWHYSVVLLAPETGKVQVIVRPPASYYSDYSSHYSAVGGFRELAPANDVPSLPFRLIAHGERDPRLAQLPNNPNTIRRSYVGPDYWSLWLAPRQAQGKAVLLSSRAQSCGLLPHGTGALFTANGGLYLTPISVSPAPARLSTP